MKITKTKPKKAKKDKVKIIGALANELLSLMGSKAKTTVLEDKDNEAILVNIETADETGLIIGKHGETISSIQVILGMLARREFDEWVRIVVNVGDYREKQETRLKELASQAASRAIETQEAQNLYNLNAAQRRVVHLFLADHPEVATESLGEGRERYLVVRPKNEKN